MDPRAPGDVRVAILSDIHHAGPAEQARGENYEFRSVAHPFLRLLVRVYRHTVWMRHPLEQGRQLDRFLAEVGPVDYVVANGDYSCDSGFIGVSDPAALQSAQECLGKLRARFGDRVRFTIGDHELGKPTLFGSLGEMRLASWHCAVQQLARFGDRVRFTIRDHELGKPTLFGSLGEMRLASWHCAVQQLGLPRFWQLAVGRYLLLGVSSSLVALPATQPETQPDEWPEWQRLREAHLAEIRAAFDALSS